MKFKFFTSFDRCDPANILFFGEFYAYAHQSLEKYIVEKGIGWEEWFDHPDWGVPIVHSEADYQSFLKAGKDFEVEIEIEKLGNSSVHFCSNFTLNDKPIAKVKTVHVFVDKASGNKRSIPEQILNKLK